MSDKVKFPRKAALAVARELCVALKPACRQDRLIVAGSLRRRKEEVGDVEIVYVADHGIITPPGELLPRAGNLADAVIADLEHRGLITRRLSKVGNEAFGPKNKLMVHVASGIPVDLFAIKESSWWNYVVCRTGPGEHNIAIANRAQEMGYKWHPYHDGLSRLSDGTIIKIDSERALFDFLGWPYLEPWERV
jgi:DNA polymerase (family 10)